MLTLSISDQYFGFHPPAEHKRACRLYGTGMWEVSKRRDERRGQTEVIIRMLCRQCGVVHTETGQGESSETTTVARIGYGSKPLRSAGLWLHPGSTFHALEDCGPTAYYLTGSTDTPQTPAEVIGVIGWKAGKRSGTIWWAAYGLNENEYGTYTDRQADTDFKSRAAAARWVADQHAQAQAAEAAKASA